MSKYITLEEGKNHLRVDFDNDDFYIQGLIDMVEEFVINDIQGEASYRISGTVNTDGVNLTGNNTFFTDYKVGDIIHVEGDHSRILATITDNATATVTVAFNKTLTDAKYRAYTGVPFLMEDGSFPKQIKHAMLILLGHFYMMREPLVLGVNVNKVPFTYNTLIAMYKNYTIG